MGCWFTVSNHDDLLGASLLCEHLSAQEKCVLHVRALHIAGRNFGKMLWFYFSGDDIKANNSDVIAGKLHRDE